MIDGTSVFGFLVLLSGGLVCRGRSTALILLRLCLTYHTAFIALVAVEIELRLATSDRVLAVAFGCHGRTALALARLAHQPPMVA